MSDDSEFRSDIRQAIRRHDPTADQLRALAADLESTADRYETVAQEI